MEFLITLAIFIVLVIAGSFINRYISRIPAALFQVALGFLVTYLPLPVHLEFESELFMAIIIAPLLFTDAYKASRADLWLYKRPIVYMAVGLVITTVVIVGSFINFIIPSISLGAAFALAAILSPTDAVAVKSITKGMKLPKGLMAILEGESLLNDAAGIVSFKIALAAIITGTFSITNASREFFVAAIGGMIVGLIIGVLTSTMIFINRKFLATEPSIHVILQLILPVVVYFIAEEFHLSGIIAVVFTGIVLNFQQYLYQSDSLDNQTTVSVNYNQDTVSYVLNGFVFVVLGYLLPDIFDNMMDYPELSMSTALIYVVLIAVALVIVRFIFVYIFYVSFQPHTFSTSSKLVEFLKTRQLDVGNYSRAEYAFITALCGIHGTVTLATALMIPLTLDSGEAFPLRDVILFVGSGVVLLSMIIGTIFLPLTIKKEEEDTTTYLNNARSEILTKVINELKEKYENNLETVPEQMGYAIALKKLYEQRTYFAKNERELVREYIRLTRFVEKEEQKKEKELLAKYDNNPYLRQIFEVRKERIKKLTTYSIFRQVFITLRLSVLQTKFKRLLVLLNLAQLDANENPHLYERRFRRRLEMDEHLKQQVTIFRPEMESIIDSLTYNAIDILEAQRNEDNSFNVDFLQHIYDRFDYTLYNVPSDSYIEESRRFETEAIAIQKKKINKLKEDNKMEHHEADTLLRDLNYNEALLYTSHEE